jgi:glycosyltransferase involved in cell wall biosynthesis
MHIALYHDALIPPPKYGGTERIVYWQARELARRGHRVTLIAQPGSHVPGAAWVEAPPGDRWEEAVPADADLVHCWSTPFRVPRRPYVVTIQGNGKPGERFLPNTLFISARHARNHGAAYFVHNGIDPEDYPCDGQRQERLVFLAKASWKVKNLAGAIEIARAAGLPLEVLGSRDLPLRLHRWLPAWRGVRYRGMVGDAEKRQVLRSARALLFPVRWHEPFGIAIIEALAAGCAVYATPYGSLPEIVTPQVGALSDRAEDLLAHLTRRERPSPSDCRKRVLDAFSSSRMAEQYLGFYAEVLARGRLGPDAGEPRTVSDRPPEELLPWHGLPPRQGRGPGSPLR